MGNISPGLEPKNGEVRMRPKSGVQKFLESMVNEIPWHCSWRSSGDFSRNPAFSCVVPSLGKTKSTVKVGSWSAVKPLHEVA